MEREKRASPLSDGLILSGAPDNLGTASRCRRRREYGILREPWIKGRHAMATTKNHLRMARGRSPLCWLLEIVQLISDLGESRWIRQSATSAMPRSLRGCLSW